MSDEKKHRFTARIADVEPFAFHITLSEEPIFRKAAYHVNELWAKMREDQPDKPSNYVLAKVALAFAELYYRKSDILAEQAKLLADFERDLDRILLRMDAVDHPE